VILLAPRAHLPVAPVLTSHSVFYSGRSCSFCPPWLACLWACLTATGCPLRYGLTLRRATLLSRGCDHARYSSLGFLSITQCRAGIGFVSQIPKAFEDVSCHCQSFVLPLLADLIGTDPFVAVPLGSLWKFLFCPSPGLCSPSQ